MLEKIKNYYKHAHTKKESLISFLILIIIVASTAFFFGTSKVTPVLLFIVLGILSLVASITAGVAVFRALTVASVSLSFLVFLGQTYCSLPAASQTANESLATLIGFGFLYSIGVFLKSLYKELYGDKELKKKGSLEIFREANNGKNPWIILIPYGVFIGIFLLQLFQVISPIVHNLCIYKK